MPRRTREDADEEDYGNLAEWRQKAADVVDHARTQHATLAFAISGHIPDMPFSVATTLQVDGLPGHLHLPVTAQQVSALLALGQPAPYGRGSETVLDSTVRNSTQIDVATVHAHEVWQQQVQQLTARAAEDLGIDTRVQVKAHPYKLLVYTEGGHFVAHKDTEKEPGMFGTLVVQLPVEGGHKGGEFNFTHNSKTVQWSTADNSDTTFHYAAFYADVEHELQPITSGARVVLVYNLVRTGTGDKPTAAESGKMVKALKDAVSSWEQALTSKSLTTPKLLCVPLEHQYTKSSLSFEALKGSDARVVSCLNHPDAGLDVHLVLMTETEVYADVKYERDDNNRSRQGGRYSDSDLDAKDSEHDSDHSWRYDQPLQSDSEDSSAWKKWYWRKGEGVPGFMGETYCKRCDEHLVTAYSLNTCVSVAGTKLPRKAAAHLGLLKPGSPRMSSYIGGMDNHLNPKMQWLAGGRVWDEKSIRGASSSQGRSEAEGNSQEARGNRKSRKISSGLQPVAGHFVPYGNEGTTVDKIYHVAMAIIWPRSKTVALLEDGSLRMAAYILDMRAACGTEAEIAAAVQGLSNLFSSHVSYPSDVDVARALQAVSKAPAQVAVPAMVSIIPKLTSLGNLNEDDNANKKSDSLPDVLVKCVVKLGTPDVLVDCLASWVKNLAQQEIAQCCALAKAAANHSEAFGTALTHALVAATVLDVQNHNKRLDLNLYKLADVAALLCRLPACRQHLHALVIFALNSQSGYYSQDCYNQAFLEKVLQLEELKAAAADAPQAVAALVQAMRTRLLKAFLHGTEQTFTLTTGFEDEQQARSWAATHLKKMPGEFGIESSVAGTGKQATLTLTKSHCRAWQVRQYEDNLQSLQPEFQRLDELLKMVEPAPGAASTDS